MMAPQPAGTYLDRIIDAHRAAAAADSRSLDALIERAKSNDQPSKGFRNALRAADGLAVVTEVKRRSPAKGDLAPDLDPATLAKDYAAGGAACLSVLTDRDFFGGSPEDLQVASEATGLPVLRKDFTVSPADVCDARLMGADAILLIVAALDDRELADLHQLARELSLDVLVEVHDEAELERALEAGADLVGVNQRDLFTFQVDHERAVRVAGALRSLGPERADVTSVAESGVRGPEDAAVLAAAGFDAVLVGETLVTSPDPAYAVQSLRTAGARGR